MKRLLAESRAREVLCKVRTSIGFTEKMLSVKMLPAAVKEMEEEIVCYRW